MHEVSAAAVPAPAAPAPAPAAPAPKSAGAINGAATKAATGAIFLNDLEPHPVQDLFALLPLFWVL